MSHTLLSTTPVDDGHGNPVRYSFDYQLSDDGSNTQDQQINIVCADMPDNTLATAQAAAETMIGQIEAAWLASL